LAVENGEESITLDLLRDERVLEALESVRLVSKKRAAF
jgi:hypothetical protein